MVILLKYKVLMLNINYNHNKELTANCEFLYGYSLYIAKFREYNENMELTETEAAIKALDYCISNNVMADFFAGRRSEVVGMILEEYTKERVERDMADMEQEIVDLKQEIINMSQNIAEKDDKIASLLNEIETLKNR